MFVIIGLVIVLAMVFGGFHLSQGNFQIILKALPYELMMIFGGGAGAFVMANSPGVLKAALGGILKAMKGSTYKQEHYRDLLCLLFILMKTIRTKGVVAIEAHIEEPHESKIFQHFPAIADDHHIVEFICDYIRMMTMNFEDPMQVEDAMTADLEKIHKEEHEPQHALNTMAEGFPAIGIVAAVLGIIKTMSAIDQPVSVLGGMIGGALVGTFLGIFLSYLVFSPLASRFNQVLQEDAQMLEICKMVMVSHLNGQAPQIIVEIGRRNIPGPYMMSFLELEEAVAEIPPDLA